MLDPRGVAVDAPVEFDIDESAEFRVDRLGDELLEATVQQSELVVNLAVDQFDDVLGGHNAQAKTSRPVIVTTATPVAGRVRARQCR